MELTAALRNELGIPDHRDLMVSLSRDNQFLHVLTDDHTPAHWLLQWRTTADEGVHGHYHYGTFSELPTALAEVLTHPERAHNAPVELDICEWALHYQLTPPVAA
ncbi:hypothetical protein [Nocardia transvalensis]|uniref:hypothetical protein n=1 Tax=Nocardia transvalensis TaxID=37333 RepID=UPI0018957C9D|nr:hypothetical protein [Nocardia transvalensis]MBF6332315.1 hypothetical protein [Nocardia transvalensis]